MRGRCVLIVCVVLVLVVSEVVDVSSAAAVRDERHPTERQVTAGRETPAAWPACLRAGRRRRTAESTGSQYAVVIDAGSSGSRVRVYRWPTPVGAARVALQSAGVEEVDNERIDRGLSSAPDLQQVSDDIYTLLMVAAGLVPEPLQRTSPVYLMATAGMRLLLEDRMNEVMSHIDAIMSNASFHPFHYASEHSSRILSGEEEGVFAWIAANYLLGFFNNDQQSGDELVGVLEMGGASTQIAFAPENDILAAKFPVLLGGDRYPLYVHSYLYYGMNVIDDRIKQRLIADSSSDASQPVDHPCMLRGDNESDANLNRTFVGRGDPSSCLLILNDLVPKAEPDDCYPKPCGIGVFYQPTIDSGMNFYAVGAFQYAIEAINAVDDDGVYVPRTGFVMAAEFCNKHIDEVLAAKPDDSRKHVRTRCFQALYTPTLFTRGYGFSNDTRQIKLVARISDQPIEWTLGAVLYEDELAAINECGAVFPVVAEVRSGGTSPVWTAHWTVSPALLVYALHNIRLLVSC